MTKFKIFLSIFSVLFFGVVFSYSLVFAGPLSKIETNFYLSDNIFFNSIDLYSNKVFIKTSENPKNIKFSGECGVSGKILETEGNNSIFNLSLSDKNCDKSSVIVTLEVGYKTLQQKFNIFYDYELYNKYLDYSDKDLEDLLLLADKNIIKFKNKNFSNTEEKVKNIRKIKELEYIKNIFSSILDGRKMKYLIPIKGATLSQRATKVPNSGRPYRSSYTDGIHHGWDFDSKKGNTVFSLDNGIVIRVVNGFTPSDFGKIKRGLDLSDQDRDVNLDILRGNQVWVKTMKGDVAFYSHLEQIFPDIKEGKILKRGEPIGTVGATGVPEEGYSDFHLHLAIQKNPLDTSKAGTYSYTDIIAWPWYFKGETSSYVIENQVNVFEN